MKEQVPSAVVVGEDLYRVPHDPVDVFIRTLGQQYMVFCPICDLAGARPLDLYAYLLERNGSCKVMPGAFAIHEGKVIYRMLVSVTEIGDACETALSVTSTYAPKILPML